MEQNYVNSIFYVELNKPKDWSKIHQKQFDKLVFNWLSRVFSLERRISPDFFIQPHPNSPELLHKYIIHVHELIVKLNSGAVYIVYRLFPFAIASLPLARASKPWLSKANLATPVYHLLNMNSPTFLIAEWILWMYICQRNASGLRIWAPVQQKEQKYKTYINLII
jgi:hypothetical protein